MNSEWRVWTSGLRRRRFVVGRWVDGKPVFALTAGGNRRRFSWPWTAQAAAKKLNEEEAT